MYSRRVRLFKLQKCCSSNSATALWFSATSCVGGSIRVVSFSHDFSDVMSRVRSLSPKRFTMVQAITYAATPPASESAQRASKLLELFRTSPYLPLRRLRCNLVHGQVVLRGSVPTFYLKQLAQTMAQKNSGNAEIVDQIEVTGSGSPSNTPVKPR